MIMHCWGWCHIITVFVWKKSWCQIFELKQNKYDRSCWEGETTTIVAIFDRNILYIPTSPVESSKKELSLQ